MSLDWGELTAMMSIKFDYAAISYLLQDWAERLDPSERAVYDALRAR